YLVKAGLPEAAVLALPAGTSTSSSLDGVARWFSGRDSRRVLLVSDGFHMLRLQIIATHLGLAPFTSPAPNSPIHANPRRNAAYFFAEGFKVPVTWLFNRSGRSMQLATRRVYSGRVVRLDVDTIRFPDGSTGELEVIRHPGAAAVVPCLTDPKGSDPTI